MVRAAMQFTELHDCALEFPQIMSGHSGKQVVASLELESPVEPVQHRGTVYVHGCSQLCVQETVTILAILHLNTIHTIPSSQYKTRQTDATNPSYVVLPRCLS